MHVAGTSIFEGPKPDYDEFREHVASRLHLVPRFRQKLRFVPFGLARPIWEDDPHLNLSYHVRQTALPPPGSDQQLRTLAARIFSQRLDRSKPLWEMWLVDGLEDDRFAIIGKSHHALVDGVSGVDINTVMFDLEREPEGPPVPPDQWLPRPEPSDAEVLAEAILDRLTNPREIAEGAAGIVRAPREIAGRLREGLGAVGALAGAGLGAPPSPFNVEIGGYRRFAWVRGDLGQLKQIKNAVGGTVNDVVLAAVTGALGRYLRARGHSTAGLELRAMIPISVRTEDERGALGNRVSAMMAPLPIGLEDPVERLHVITETMGDLKASRQAVGRDATHRANRVRAPDDRRPGGAAAIAPALLQPRRDERPGAAVPALRPRAGDARDIPDGAPRKAPGGVRRDHELQRPGQLRAHRRLRRDARSRSARR